MKGNGMEWDGVTAKHVVQPVWRTVLCFCRILGLHLQTHTAVLQRDFHLESAVLSAGCMPGSVPNRQLMSSVSKLGGRPCSAPQPLGSRWHPSRSDRSVAQPASPAASAGNSPASVSVGCTSKDRA